VEKTLDYKVTYTEEHDKSELVKYDSCSDEHLQLHLYNANAITAEIELADSAAVLACRYQSHR
jgi:hypothetical protein